MSYELRIGLLAAICITVTIWGYKFMKGKNLLNLSNYFYAEYTNINELSTSSPVLIRGLRVGTVSEVKLSKDMRSIIATLDINRGISIPKNTEALVVNTSIMGGKAIVLDIAGSCEGDACATRGDTLTGRVQGFFESMFAGQDIDTYVAKMKAGLGDLVTDLSDSLAATDSSNEFAKTFQALQQVLTNLAGITHRLNASMSVYDRKMISILENIEGLSGTLADNSAVIASTIANFEALSGDLKDAEIDQTSKALQDAIHELDGVIASADKSFKSLETLLSEIDSEEGSLGLLLKDKELYDNFTETSRQLALLLQDFRLNPKRYVNVSVFGKKQREYELPEEDPAEKDE